MIHAPTSGAPLPASPWLDGLPPGRRTALLAAGQKLKAADGAAVYRAGDPPSGLFLVIQGRVRLVAYPTPGRQLVTLVVAPGDWIGELSTLDGGPRPHEATAVGDAVLLHVPQRAIDRLAADDPGLYRDIALLACAHQRAALGFIGAMLGLSVRGRLAQILLGLAERSDADEAGRPSLRVSQEDLAGPVGLSRQTLNRYLRAFQTEGLIAQKYGRIILLDPSALSLVR